MCVHSMTQCVSTSSINKPSGRYYQKKSVLLSTTVLSLPHYRSHKLRYVNHLPHTRCVFFFLPAYLLTFLFYYHPQSSAVVFLLASVCMFVCMYVCNMTTVESHDIESSFWSVRISPGDNGSGSHMKVIGSRSRSQQHESTTALVP